MNITKLREEIAYDEGRVCKIYRDHLGFPTFGIGHLITPNDPEYRQPIGTPIKRIRVRSVLGFLSDSISLLMDVEQVLQGDMV